MINIKDSSINSFKTKILKKEVINGKIEPKTDPYYDRSIEFSRFVFHSSFLAPFLKELSEEESLHFYYNTLSNKNGGILMPAELAYQIDAGKPLKPGTRFRSSVYLEDLKGEGVLKEIASSSFRRGVATEVRVNPTRGLSVSIAHACFSLIHSDLGSLIEEIQEFYVVQVQIRKYWDDERQQEKCQTMANLYATPDKAKTDCINATKYVVALKRTIENGLTSVVLEQMVEDYIPGIQPERRLATFNLLIERLHQEGYQVPDWEKGQLKLRTWCHTVQMQRRGKKEKAREVMLQDMGDMDLLEYQQTRTLVLLEAEEQDLGEEKDNQYQAEEHQQATCLESRGTDHEQLERWIEDRGTGQDTTVIYDIANAVPEINLVQHPITPPSSSQSQSPSSSQSRSPLPLADVPPPLIYPKLRPIPLPALTPSSHSPSILRSLASDLLTANSASYISALNEALTYRLITYDAQDDCDLRQRSHMISDGCLPFLYKTLSSVSPRVYGRGGDNLFYCRKEMRLHAMEGLGFMDVDLENCHVQIALSLWGKHLPFLKEEISKGSLWSSYEKRYKEANLPFYKSLIKSMHHATFLGGGRKARLKAWKSYNNHHPGKGIREDDFRAIEKVFTSSPIYKELKALFRRLSNKFHHKEITLPTGEKLIARRMTRKSAKRKKAGEKDDPGNMLTVIAAILQSIEVSIVSYMIVKTQHLYVPILWQHDGLTIKSLDPNIDVVGEMQKAVDEYCMHHLGRSMKLVGVPL